MWKSIVFTCFALPAFADAPVVENVEARQSGDTWQFSVTLSHADTGWDDYADGWRIEAHDGTILGTRVLAHPHVNEQPFTRSLGDISIPQNATVVFVRAKDLIDGWAKDRSEFILP